MKRAILALVMLLCIAVVAHAIETSPGPGGPGGVTPGGAIQPGSLTCPAGSNCTIGEYDVNHQYNVQNPKYGASGDPTPITCTADGTTGVLTACSSTTGWTAGTNQYALILNAGLLTTVPATPAAPTATGTTGGATPGASTSYYYEVVDCHLVGFLGRGPQCSAASPATTVVTQIALTPGSTNFSKVVLSGMTATGSTVTFHKIYRSINASGGPFTKLDEVTGTSYTDYGQPAASQDNLPFDDPATAPAAATAETVDVNITAVAGSTITVATPPAVAQAGTVTLYHENRVAIQAAIDAAAANGGGEVYFPTGTYVVSPLSNVLGGFFVNHIIDMLGGTYSNITLRGAGPYASLIRVGSATQAGFNGSGNAIIEVGGALNAATFPSHLAITNLSAPISAGDNCAFVASTTGFNPGDYAFIRTGQNVTQTDDPTSEMNIVATVDATLNRLCFRYPAARPYVQEYFITSTTGQTAPAPLYSAYAANAVHVLTELVTCATNCPAAVPTIFKVTTVTASTGGNAGATEPNWNTNCPVATNTCTDGNLTWTNLGTAAGQAALFGVADMTAVNAAIHDIAVRDMGFIAPEGGEASATTGFRDFNVIAILNMWVDNIYSRTRDTGDWGFGRNFTLSHSNLYTDAHGQSSGFGPAESYTEWTLSHNTFTAGHCMSYGMTESSTIRIDDNSFNAGFPCYVAPFQVAFGGVADEFIFTNNRVCGSGGAGVFAMSSSPLTHPTDTINITGNTFECPFGAAFPDAKNIGGIIFVRDPNSANVSNNLYSPSGAWDEAQIQGMPGYGNSNIGSRGAPLVWKGKLNFSQAATTTVLPLGTIPSNSALDSCQMRVTTPFNAATTNVITIGGSVTQTTYLTTAFGGTSIASGLNIWDYTTNRGMGDGTTHTLNSAAQNVTTVPPNAANNLTMYYSFTGTAPTAGVALVTCYGHVVGQ